MLLCSVTKVPHLCNGLTCHRRRENLYQILKQVSVKHCDLSGNTPFDSRRTTSSCISLDDDCSEIKWSVIHCCEMINARNSALSR